MNKNFFVPVVIVAVILTIVFFAVNSMKEEDTGTSNYTSEVQNQEIATPPIQMEETTPSESVVAETMTSENNQVGESPTTEALEPNCKEFNMTSFTEYAEDGSPKPQYSLKEITVNKGDKVKINITVTSGMHDFKIDEFNVYADTMLNQVSTVEFTADKAGEFIYYCTKPEHRQNGHWGTLKVVE